MSTPPTPRPHVACNVAMSLDGKIAPASRERGAIASRLDRRRMDGLRAEVDAVLIGAQTLRNDDPPLHLRDPAALAHRASLGLLGQPRAIVLSASGDVPAASRLWRPGDAAPPPHALAPPLLATTAENGPLALARTAGRAEVWASPGPGPGVDVGALLAHLHGLGVRRLLVEGGGATLWAFVHAGALDAVHVTLAPCLLGGREAPTPVDGAGLSLAERLRLRLRGCEQVGDELYLTYDVAAAAAGAPNDAGRS